MMKDEGTVSIIGETSGYYGDSTTSESPKLFRLKPTCEWIEYAKSKPAPKQLFGEFWSEGELAILFADTGMGKSVLAVQLAESIASGETGDVFPTTAKPQKVLYLDFELTEKQFEMRYCDELDEGEELGKNHYRFSPNFFRAEIDPTCLVPKKYKTFTEFLSIQIEDLIEETEASVLIVDNITFLRQTNESSREAIELMSELKALKNKHSLSILVLAHTRKRGSHRPISLSDLQGSRILANFADSIFAIGSSSISHDARYLKHIKQRSREIVCDAESVAGFTLSKNGKNFLSFRFVDFSLEVSHLKDIDGVVDIKFHQTRRIQDLAASGKSQRTIAAELGISAATVNRYLHMFAPGGRTFAEAYYPNLEINPAPADPARPKQHPNNKQPNAPAPRSAFIVKSANEWVEEAIREMEAERSNGKAGLTLDT